METKTAVEALNALAQESRLEIFRLLVREGVRGSSAGAIGERLEFAPATLSFHLSTLRHARLIESRREGRQIIYSARLEAISELMGFVLEDCCEGHPEACAFLTEAEPKIQRC